MYGEFELLIPEDVDEALGCLAAANGDRMAVLAGGTNLLVDIRSRRTWPAFVLSLDRLDALRGIETAGAEIRAGARTTVTDLLHSATIGQSAPALAEAARVFAGQMVRNAATIGGNIACGSPAADLVPALLTLDAVVDLQSARGSRSVSLDSYFIGYKADLRCADELITAVRWARSEVPFAHRFYKLARRRGDAITVAGVSVRVSRTGDRCHDARIALVAAAPFVLRASEAEQALEGECLTVSLIDHAAKTAAGAVAPIDDIRASASYRRRMVEVLTRRLLTQAWRDLSTHGESK